MHDGPGGIGSLKSKPLGSEGGVDIVFKTEGSTTEKVLANKVMIVWASDGNQ